MLVLLDESTVRLSTGLLGHAALVVSLHSYALAGAGAAAVVAAASALHLMTPLARMRSIDDAESHFTSACRLAPALAMGPTNGPRQLLKYSDDIEHG